MSEETKVIIEKFPLNETERLNKFLEHLYSVEDSSVIKRKQRTKERKMRR